MHQLFDLTGKSALVTGASSGMGKAIAEVLGMHGANLIISSNDTEACRDTVWQFQQNVILAHALPGNVAEPEQCQWLYQEARQLYGTIDIPVSCVGIAVPAPFLSIEENSFQQAIGINLHSALHLSQPFIPGMQAQKDGVIVFLASIACLRGNKNIGLYGITKAGITQMARNLAVEFGRAINFYNPKPYRC